MAQRLTTDRQLYFGVETTEGAEVVATDGAAAVTLTNLQVGPDVAFNARSILGQIGRIKGNIGAQTDPSLSFTVQCRGGGTSVVPKLDPLLKVVLSQGVSDSGNTTIESGSTKSVLNVADAAGFSVGNAVAVETGNGTNVYEAGWVTATFVHPSQQDTITLSHELTFASNPAVGARVKPSITYRPQNTGHTSLSFQLWLEANGSNGKRMGFTGCKGSMKFDVAAPGAVPTMTFNFDAIAWNTATGTRPTPTYDTAGSPTSYKFKIDSTPYDAKLGNWDLRQVIARKRSQNSVTGTIAQLVTNRDLMGFIHSYDVDETQYTEWQNGTEQAIAHQFGSTLFNIVAYQIPKAQRRRVSYGDDNGLTTDRLSFEGNVTNGADEILLAFL